MISREDPLSDAMSIDARFVVQSVMRKSRRCRCRYNIEHGSGNVLFDQPDHKQAVHQEVPALSCRARGTESSLAFIINLGILNLISDASRGSYRSEGMRSFGLSAPRLLTASSATQ
jgi:hypothetical protein